MTSYESSRKPLELGTLLEHKGLGTTYFIRLCDERGRYYLGRVSDKPLDAFERMSLSTPWDELSLRRAFRVLGNARPTVWEKILGEDLF